MKVLKFGGTSVGTIKSIQQVYRIVSEISEESDESIIVVVSAFAGVTNSLAKLIEQVLSNRKQSVEIIEELKKKHQEYYVALTGLPPSEHINKLIENLSEVCHGISLLKEATQKSTDFILATGEMLSSYIIHAYFEKHIECRLLAAPQYLIISDKNTREIDWKVSLKKLKAVSPYPKVIVFPGFIASTSDGIITTLGRGGSDFTASILANLLDASEIQIWTDVDGIMSADPRYVRQAKLVKHLSYEEALELSHFGAKVLYPPTVQPALVKNIPIKIKNTFSPKEFGTLITKDWDHNKKLIRSLSSIANVVTINISGTSMLGSAAFSYRFFKVFFDLNIHAFMVTQASSEHSLCTVIEKNQLALALSGLKKEFATELESQLIYKIDIEEQLAIIALVGSNMRNQLGVSGRMFHTLGKNGVNIKAIAQGSSERNISVVIRENDLKKALNILHEAFFLSEKKRINLFIIGVGNVGSTLLAQLVSQKINLSEKLNLFIKVVGLANSKKMIFNEEGIDLKTWEDLLNQGVDFDMDAFLTTMKALNLRNSVFIDNTASKEIAACYPKILEATISVVTPNKIAATSSYENVKQLQTICKQSNAQFLFETNVAAGLPVISTLRDLLMSGDQILRIEAVLSGTLNFLFNTYDGKVPFVEVVQEARRKGLTEPDPREDLFGGDVKRKILILARETGTTMEIDDVAYETFIPEKCLKAADLDSFYRVMLEQEQYFSDLYQKAIKSNTKLRVVAQFENKKASIKLKYIPKSHPFYFLEGQDNIILFYTKNYHEQPLVIKGAGAGSEVTASGIFTNIIKASNA